MARKKPSSSSKKTRDARTSSPERKVRRPGSKALILDFFLSNLGKVLESREIQEASGGAVEWARRVRELRIQILSQVRRATIDDQHAVLEWLLEKFRLKAVAHEE